MNPWDIPAWVAAIGLSLVIVFVVLLVVVSIVREIVNPGPRLPRAKSKRIDVS
jgi:hypothetical protein